MNSADAANDPQRPWNIGLWTGRFNGDECYVKPGSHMVVANFY